MRNAFKKMILTAALVITTLVVLPATVEAKTKNLTYNINKVTADEFCKDVYAKGVTAHCLERDKNKYKITLTVKAKSEKDGVKKVESFAKKVKKAKSNKYGLSYGVSLKDDYNWYRYNNKKKVLTVKLANTANDLYYLNCITRDALQTNWIESTKCSVKTKTVFPDSETFKKASESAKTQTVLYYMGHNCMYGNTDAKGTKISWKKLYEHKQEGVCSDFAQMQEKAVRLIAYDYTAQHEISWAANHEILLVGIKNSEGSYDYFDGNNGGFYPYRVDSKVVKDKTPVTYGFFDSWQVSEPKIYKVTKLEKEAFKWGKAKKSSDLEKMYMNR